MFSRIRDFFSRHRRKFIVTGVLVGGSYLAYRLALKKLRDFQEKQTREFLEQSRRTQHFESTERTCNQVIVGISSKMYDEIIRQLSTEDVQEKLRQKPENRVELWNELKIRAFTRLTVFIYASTMLTITLRTQMNILGGYLYKHSKSDGDNDIPEELREKYLSLIQYFLEEGITDLSEYIKSKVTECLSGYELGQRLNISDIEQIFWAIQMAINSDTSSDPNSKLAKYLLPKTPGDSQKMIIQMFNETIDVLESDEIVSLCSSNICRGFAIAVDNISEYIDGSNTPKIQELNEQDAVEVSKKLLNINKIELPLAKLIPIVCGITTKGVNNKDRPQNLATSLTTFNMVNEKIKMLGANLYESFCV